MRAIETRYKGYRFRSRLEARWAVFFDAMRWQWEYEPEGFDLGDGVFYLPDFKVFGRDSNGDYNVFWFEVKHSETTISDKESEKILRFAYACHEKNLTIGYGDFILLDGPPRITVFLSCGSVIDPENWKYQPLAWAMDAEYREGRPTFDFCDREDNANRARVREWLLDEFHVPINLTAIELARAARFEHGECG